MPDLTIVACPTCGLPAEILGFFPRDLGEGPVEHAQTRCVALHIASLMTGLPDGPTPQASPQAVVFPLVLAASSQSAPTASLRPLVAAVLGDWWRPLLWSIFGALAGLLFMAAPPLAIVVVPLTLTLSRLAAAHWAWRPLFPVAQAASPAQLAQTSVPEAVAQEEQESHREAA